METYRRRGNTVKGNQRWKETEEETRELRGDGPKARDSANRLELQNQSR